MLKYSNIQTDENFIFDTCFVFEGKSRSLHMGVRKFKSVSSIFLERFGLNLI